MDVNSVLDEEFVEVRKAKKRVDREVANAGGRESLSKDDVSSDKGSFYTGSSEEEEREVVLKRRKRTSYHYDPRTMRPHVCKGMVFGNNEQFKGVMNKFSMVDRYPLNMPLNDYR